MSASEQPGLLRQNGVYQRNLGKLSQFGGNVLGSIICFEK